VRLLLGALVLVALFLAAATWQRRFSEAARDERNAELGRPVHGVEAPPEGWSVVTVGRPGGGEPFGATSPAPTPARAPGSPAGAAPAKTPPPAAPQAPSPSTPAPSQLQPQGGDSSAWLVEPGQSLSGICSTRYGTARAEVVDAVARHNGLSSPDLVRQGQRLDLPPIERLLPKR
jgi:hypothetical protein